MLTDELVASIPRVKGSTGVSGNWLYSLNVEIAERSGQIPPPHKYPAGDKPEYYQISARFSYAMPFITDVAFLLASDIPNRVMRAKKRVAEALSTIGQEHMLLILDSAESEIMGLPVEDGKTVNWNGIMVIAYHVAFLFIRRELLGYDIGEDTDALFAYEVGRSPLLPDGMHFIPPPGVGWMLDMLRTLPVPTHVSRRSKAIDWLMKLMGSAYMKFQVIQTQFIALLPPIDRSATEIRQEILAPRKYALWPGVTDIDWHEKGLEGLSLCPLKNGGVQVLFHLREKGEPINYFLLIPSLEKELDVPDVTEAVALEAIRMCVAPPEMKVRGNRVPGGYVKAPNVRAATDGLIPVTFVPRVRYVQAGNEERSESGSSRTPVRAHQVQGFLRQLPFDWHASLMARNAAAESGITLPEAGFTFVRPHHRGSGEAAEIQNAPRRVKVRRGKNNRG